MLLGKWIQILSKNVHKISCMQYELVLDLGQMVGQLISKLEEKLWDIDIKNVTVSPIDQIKCTHSTNFRFPFSWMKLIIRQEGQKGQEQHPGAQSVSLKPFSVAKKANSQVDMATRWIWETGHLAA